MKKFSLFLISFLIGAVLFAWVINLVGWKEIKDSLSALAGFRGLVILFLTLILFFVMNWKWKEILQNQGITVSFFDLLKSYLAGFSVMYFFPTFLFGGEFLRSYILKKRHSVDFPKGVASVLIDRILDWTTNLIIASVGIILFIFYSGIMPRNISIYLYPVFFFWSFVILFFYFRAFKKESIVKFIWKFFRHQDKNSGFLETEKETFAFFNHKDINFWKILGIAFLEELIILFRIFLMVDFFGKKIIFLSAIPISGFAYLATMIPIPASLGINDAVQIVVFSSLGLGASLGAAFVLIIRGIEVILALTGTFLLFRFGIKLFGGVIAQDEVKEISNLK